MSKPKAPPPPAERQATRAPSDASSGGLADEIAKRRRALSMTAMTGGLGMTGGPATTAVLGG